MGAKKIRIGGWVDKQLKVDLRKYGAAKGNPAGKKPVSQARAMANLLAEEVARRKRAKRKG